MIISEKKLEELKAKYSLPKEMTFQEVRDHFSERYRKSMAIRWNLSEDATWDDIEAQFDILLQKETENRDSKE